MKVRKKQQVLIYIYMSVYINVYNIGDKRNNNFILVYYMCVETLKEKGTFSLRGSQPSHSKLSKGYVNRYLCLCTSVYVKINLIQKKYPCGQRKGEKRVRQTRFFFFFSFCFGSPYI